MVGWLIFFFFKQKTAYEMRISDWSSDVCSSDLQCSLTMGYAILNAAGLSFIGLGIAPPTPEWGILVAEGATYMISGEWWVALFPGLALMTAVFCFNLLGDGLRDIVDPRRRT